jgi:hypothetical protein
MGVIKKNPATSNARHWANCAAFGPKAELPDILLKN